MLLRDEDEFEVARRHRAVRAGRDRAYLVLAATAVTGEFLSTFKDFPPRQKAPSFTVDQAMEKLEAGIASA